MSNQTIFIDNVDIELLKEQYSELVSVIEWYEYISKNETETLWALAAMIERAIQIG